MRRSALMLAPLALVFATAPGAATTALATQTKKQAEVNALTYVARSASGRRLPGIVNPRTHLLVNNTEAVCRGHGRRYRGNRYPRFTCVVRPRQHTSRQGLYLRYRALPRGRYAIRWLRFVRA
jgi:hypothetical protein